MGNVNPYNFEYGWCLCHIMQADVIALADVSATWYYGRHYCLGRCYCHIYYIMVADVIATRQIFQPFITWQMILPYDIVVDGKTTQIACYNSCLAGVICLVADGIATVGWMCMEGVNTNWQMEQPRVCFNLVWVSVVLHRTSSQICGRWNLPMFLLRGGLLTLINNASFIALLRFLVLPPYYTKIISGDPVTSGVKMVKNWGGCLLMFLEPLSKSSWGLSNVFLITIHPITFVSIDDPNFYSGLDLGLLGPPEDSWWCCLL